MADPYGYNRPTVVDLDDNINTFRRKVNQISNDLGDKFKLLTGSTTSFEMDSDMVGALVELDYRINQQDSDLYLRIDGGNLFLHNGKTNTVHGQFIYDSAAGSLQLNAPRGNFTIDALGDITLDADGNDIIFKNGAGGDTVTHTLANDGNFVIAAPANYTVDTVGDITLDADGGNLFIQDGGVTQFEFLTGTNKEIDVPSGDLTFDVAGNIILNADGNTITFRNGDIPWIVNHIFDDTNGNFEVTAPGDYDLDVAGKIILDADGNDIIFKNGAGADTVTHTLADTGAYTITQSGLGDYTVDVGGDIILDADGNDIIFKNGAGADTVTHTLADDANYTITAPANYTVDVEGDITLDANGNDIYLRDGGNLRVQYNLGNNNAENWTGNLIRNVTGSLKDSAGTSIEIVSGTTFTQTSGGNFTTNVTGEYLVDVSGDITLDADGNDIIFKNGAGADTVTHTLADDANYTITAPGDYDLDVVGDITLSTDGNDIVFDNGAGADTVTHTLADDGAYTIALSGTNGYTVDVGGVITLDADGNDIVFKNGAGGDAVFHTLADDANYTIVSPANYTVDTVGTITLDADGNDFIFKNGVAGGTSTLTLSDDTRLQLTTQTDFTVDAGGIINLDAGDDQIFFKNDNVTRITYTLGATTDIALAGNLTTNVGGSIVDSAGTTYTRVAGTNISDTATTGTITQTSGTTFDQVSGGNFTTTVTGNVLVDASGDITLDADGNDIIFKNGAGGDQVTHSLADGTNYNIAAPGNYTVDVVGDITLDAAGDNIIFADAGSSRVTYTLGATTDIAVGGSLTTNVGGTMLDSSTGDMTFVTNANYAATSTGTFNQTSGGNFTTTVTGDVLVDASGDITLDADGNDIIFKNGSGADTVTHTLADDANYTITAPANYTVDAVGDIILDADGREIKLKDAGLEFGVLYNSNGDFGIYSSQDDKDMLFQGSDAGSVITALTLDMSDSGSAIFNHDAYFSDNGRLVFGADSDLKIYHDGSHSYVSDQGTGSLKIRGSGAIDLEIADGSEYLARFLADDAVLLYHNGNEKLATTATGIAVTGDTTFPDNGKAIFGAGSDLQIYHDGSNSYIDETATGHLFIRSNGDGIYLRSSTDEEIAHFNVNGSVKAYYDNSLKLETTSTGIDVTGTVTADGFQTDTANTNVNLLARNSSNAAVYLQNGGTGDVLHVRSGNMAAGQGDLHLKVANNGDISFYDSVGTSQSFFWDASAESLGIGTASPDTLVHLAAGAGSAVLRLENTDAFLSDNEVIGKIEFETQDAGGAGVNAYIQAAGVSTNGAAKLEFGTGGGNSPSTRMTINSNGNVGIGTGSPTGLLHLSSSAPAFYMTDTTNNTEGVISVDNAGSLVFNADLNNEAASSNIRFAVDGTERLHIDARGAVGINAVPEAWDAAFSSVLQVGAMSVLTSGGDNARIFGNAYYDGGSTYKRINTGFAQNYEQTTGEHRWYNAASGAADSTFTWVESMRIDASGNVGIGVIPKTTNVTVTGSLNVNHAGILVRNNNQSYYSSNIYWDAADQLKSHGAGYGLASVFIPSDGSHRFFNTTAAATGADQNLTLNETMRIDSSGDLNLVNSGLTSLNFTTDGSLDYARITGGKSGSGEGELQFWTYSGGISRAATIDPSGNLLVGTTDNNPVNNGTDTSADDGVVLGASGSIAVARYNNTPMFANRTGTFGAIIDFRKSGAAVGSISVVDSDPTGGGGELLVASGNTGLKFDDQANYIRPCNATGALRDNIVDLGKSDSRFKDLHLSGTAFLPTVDIGAGDIDNVRIGFATSASYIRVTELEVTDTISAPLITPNVIDLNDYNSGTNTNLIKFGNDSDMAIYHDGANSYINHKGTGDLRILADSFRIRNAADNANMVIGSNGGAVTLYHNGNAKLATTSTGVTVTGLLTADTKSFTIDHPTKEGMKLRYGSLEGPEHGVYVRGRLSGTNTIELPEVWTGLVDADTITVNLTPIGKGECWVEDIQNNTVTVGGHLNCFYMVLAERKDVEKLEVEFPSNGS